MSTTKQISIRLNENVLGEIDAEAKRLGVSRNLIIARRVEKLPPLYSLDVKTGIISVVDESGPGKKIADVSVGAAAQDGLGVDPGLPRGGKAQLEEIFRDVKVNIGLRAQGHFETVKRMRGEGKSWDEIGNAIGWAGHAVQEWYQMESPKFPQWSEARMRKMAAAEDEALSATGGLLACSPEFYAEMEKTVKDACKVCHGSKGGVSGNENIVNGRVLCDYCHAEQMVPTVIDKEKMNMLRDICAGKIPAGLVEKPAEPIEVDLCGREEYNPDTGQTGACGLAKGHKGKCGAWEVVG